MEQAAKRGTAMHSYLETYIQGGKILDLRDVGREASSMAETIIAKGFNDLEEIWGSEVTLFYPNLYAGATELCGVYQGRESIIDFKQTDASFESINGSGWTKLTNITVLRVWHKCHICG